MKTSLIIIIILTLSSLVYGQVYTSALEDGLLLSNIPRANFACVRQLKKNNRVLYQNLINAASQKYALSPQALEAVIDAESQYNPRALSCKGAQGLMQLMPQTAWQLGVSNPFDPEQNIDAGARYLKQMLDKFGALESALAAYNAGPGAVERYGGIPPYQETKEYVKKICSKVSDNFHVSQVVKKDQSGKIKQKVIKKIKVKTDNNGDLIISN
ncbi:lytic transglycosylase domain-containing protein [candidate division TA06 bacterium]|uniref:Lytic transglycosylase domain-containing protein n=1 Tax=candidate division TA06 bacterium TaxID=2250710 RepID=A0A933I876_UNCT6|nr:lytic transglycosylase domain-containing protein [candidate division TA06 bacterium]